MKETLGELEGILRKLELYEGRIALLKEKKPRKDSEQIELRLLSADARSMRRLLARRGIHPEPFNCENNTKNQP